MQIVIEGTRFIAGTVGYYYGEEIEWTYTVTAIPGTATASDFLFTPFSGSQVGGTITIAFDVLADRINELSETFQILVEGTAGPYQSAYSYVFDYSITNVPLLRDEIIQGAFERAAKLWDPSKEKADFLQAAWGDIVKQRELSADFTQDTELRDAERYVLGVIGATVSPIVAVYIFGSPAYEGAKAVADLRGWTFMRSDPNLPTSPPGGILSSYLGLIEGRTGLWTSRLPADVDDGGVVLPLLNEGVATGAAVEGMPHYTVYVRTSESSTISYEENGAQFTVTRSPDIPVGVSGIILHDELGGEYSLTAGADTLFSNKSSIVHLGAGDDLAVLSQASVVDGGDGADRLILSDFDDVARGGAGADFLLGGDGADALAGDGDNDLLDGGLGADTMNGGSGNDAYYVDNAADRVIESSATGGLDHVRSSVSFSLLGQHVENLTLIGLENINGTGNSLANILTGNAGANVLDGRTGADTMNGGAGDDTYYVDAAGDKVIESSATGGLDHVRSTVTFSLLGQHIENLTLTGLGNISGTGNSYANILTGNGGANILDGRTGADTMNGGAGNDTYYVDNAGDKVIESSATGGLDHVRSSVTFSLVGQHIENLSLTGLSNVNATGNTLANFLTGNAGANVLDGRTGADTMNGGAGNDTYYVDNAGDKIIESSATGGLDHVRSSVTFSLLGQHIENLTLTGLANINGTGNSLANILTGNAGANVLDGRTGADTMNGGAGNDILAGGQGNDLLNGGEGLDKYVFSNIGDTDTILGFVSGSDIIDLSAIDANTAVAENQGFSFVGSNEFTRLPGELRTYADDQSNYVAGDVNGDGTADFIINIGKAAVVETDFIL